MKSSMNMITVIAAFAFPKIISVKEHRKSSIREIDKEINTARSSTLIITPEQDS